MANMAKRTLDLCLYSLILRTLKLFYRTNRKSFKTNFILFPPLLLMLLLSEFNIIKGTIYGYIALLLTIVNFSIHII